MTKSPLPSLRGSRRAPPSRLRGWCGPGSAPPLLLLFSPLLSALSSADQLTNGLSLLSPPGWIAPPEPGSLSGADTRSGSSTDRCSDSPTGAAGCHSQTTPRWKEKHTRDQPSREVTALIFICSFLFLSLLLLFFQISQPNPRREADGLRSPWLPTSTT